MDPLISIVIPVYNVEKYLKICVDSVIKQTYENIEIILVDDGSTDSSSYICDMLSKEDKRIYVIHKKNEGLGLARNTGIDVAKGKYIIFIDSDDFVNETMVEDLLKASINNNCDTVKDGCKRVDENGNYLFDIEVENQVFIGNSVVKKMLPRMIGSAPDKKDSILMSAWNVLYSMNLIRKYNLKFESERKYISEDIIFNLSYFKYSKGVALINNCNYRYRINNNSLTGSYKKDRFKLSKILFKKEKELMIELGIFELSELRWIRNFFTYVLMCIKQENTSISGMKFKDALKNIKEICNDSFLKNAIEKFPINKLGFKQRFFIYLLKYKCVRLLYITTRLI